MCSTTASSSSSTLDGVKLVKFVELLVHDYLSAKGFTATGEKFAEECSKCAQDRGGVGCAGSGSTASNDGPAVDEANSWYYLADKLALPVGWLPVHPTLLFLRMSTHGWSLHLLGERRRSVAI